MFVKKWDMAKAKLAFRNTKRRIKKLLQVIETVRRSVWLSRIIKASKWFVRFTWGILRKVTWPIWSPFVLLKWVLQILWAFIWGKKSRAAHARIAERKRQQEKKRQERLRLKPNWRRWFGILLLAYFAKLGLIKLSATLLSPWTAFAFLVKRLLNAKGYLDEREQDKRDLAIEREQVLAEEQARLDRLKEQKNTEKSAARQVSSVLQALRDF